MREHALQNAILRALAGRTDLRIWRNNTGAAKNVETGSFVRYGIPGQGDLSGLLINGRRLEIETKTAEGRLSKNQRAFRDMITKYGGLYIVARSVEDTVGAVDAALSQSSEAAHVA